jgi:hypothetical protein
MTEESGKGWRKSRGRAEEKKQRKKIREEREIFFDTLLVDNITRECSTHPLPEDPRASHQKHNADCVYNRREFTSGCRSSPSGCGRAPSRHRRRRRWPCSRCRPRRCRAGGPGRSGRRPWRTGRRRSDRRESGTSARGSRMRSCVSNNAKPLRSAAHSQLHTRGRTHTRAPAATAAPNTVPSVARHSSAALHGLTGTRCPLPAASKVLRGPALPLHRMASATFLG